LRPIRDFGFSQTWGCYPMVVPAVDRDNRLTARFVQTIGRGLGRIGPSHV